MMLFQIEGFMLLNSHGSDCMWLCGMLTLCVIQYYYRFVCRAVACSCALPACLVKTMILEM